MDDLDRLFHYLVEHLVQTSPERLHKPFQVSELYQRLAPYRTHKRQLGFESIADYEMAVLRLLAGEHGYATVEPPDVQEALAAEAKQVNPDPGAFREFAAASVVLDREAVRRIANQDAAYAPPESRTPITAAAPPSAPTPVESEAAPEDVTKLRMAAVETRELVFEPVGETTACHHCDQSLPAGREAVYCPFCGEQLEVAACRSCGDPVEPGWSYCLSCGTSVRGS